MRESVRIFFACALGALFGGLLGLELNSVSTWLWLPAAMVGGVVGWITYNIHTLGAAIARAWREVIGWRPDRLYWRLFGESLLLSIITLGYGAALMLTWYASFLLADAGWYAFPALRTTAYELYWTVVCPITFLSIAGATMLALGGLYLTYTDIHTEAGWHQEFDWLIKTTHTTALLANPITLPFATLYGCYKLAGYSYCGVRWCIPRLPILGRFAKRSFILTGQLAKRAFVLAHSDMRLLCFVDATIGAIAGYFLGSALLGALIGGAWGLLNYWVVSVKLLHLSPVHVRNE